MSNTEIPSQSTPEHAHHCWCCLHNKWNCGGTGTITGSSVSSPAFVVFHDLLEGDAYQPHDFRPVRIHRKQYVQVEYQLNWSRVKGGIFAEEDQLSVLCLAVPQKIAKSTGWYSLSELCTLSPEFSSEPWAYSPECKVWSPHELISPSSNKFGDVDESPNVPIVEAREMLGFWGYSLEYWTDIKRSRWLF